MSLGAEHLLSDMVPTAFAAKLFRGQQNSVTDWWLGTVFASKKKSIDRRPDM